MISSEHVVVIGGGALALEAARALVTIDKTVRVTVISGGPVPAASEAAGAMIAPWSETTELSAAANDHDDRMEWTVSAHGLWRERLEGALWDGRPVITGRGTFLVANTMSGPIEDRNFRAIEKELVQRSVAHERVDPGEVPGLDPAPYARPHAAIHIPDEFTVESGALLAWSRAQLLDSTRVEFLEGIARPVLENGRLLGAVTMNGRLVRASAVLVAAGVTTRRILPAEVQAEVPPLIPGAGGALVLHPMGSTGIRSCIRTPNRAFACGLHVLPTGDGNVYVGATNNVLPEPWARVSASDVEFLARCARTQVNRGLALAGVTRLRAGNRPISADGAPVLGPTSIPGLHVMTGTYRDGLTQSPALAHAVASEVLGGRAGIPNAWRPGRAPTALTPEHVIRSVVEHQLASIGEHEVDLSHAGVHQEVADFYTEHARRALVAWGAVGPYVSPEVLAFIARDDRVGQEIFDYFEPSGE